MLPEEKMAARVLARANLSPPFNLMELVEKYATIEYLSFPVEADGVTIGLGKNEQPHILINSDKPKTRQQFTLAHELGHVIIPWHTGIIASHIDDTSGSEDYEYREMEAEANRFASEILIPSDWLRNQFDWSKNFVSSFTEALEATGASRDAFLIKLFNTLKHHIFCVQLSETGTVVKRYRCGGALAHEDIVNSKQLEDYFSKQPFNREEFKAGDRKFVAWISKPVNIPISDTRPWREILNQILAETNSQIHLASINAILPVQVNAHRGLSIDEICSKVVLSYQGRSKISEAVAHPLFSQYVIKRVMELKK